VRGVTSYGCSLSDAVLELAQSSRYLYNSDGGNVALWVELVSCPKPDLMSTTPA
jgi:hypothetical protein